MRRPARHSLALVVALASAFVASVAPVRADGPAAPVAAPTAPLTGEEMAVVRRRFPDWDRLEPAMQQKIAQNVRRFFAMPPEKRDRLLERAKHVDPAALPDRMAKFDGFRPDQQNDVRRGRQFARVIGLMVVQGVPADVRPLLDSGSRGALLNEVERLALENCFVRTWMKKAAEPLVAAPPLAAEPSKGVPEPFAAKFREARDAAVSAGGARAPVPALRLLAERYVQDRILAADHAAPPADPDEGPKARFAHVRAVAESLRAQFPEATESVAKAVADAARGGRDRLLAMCERDLAPLREARLADLFVTLERQRVSVGLLGVDALQHVDALQGAILGALRIPEYQVEQLRNARGPGERLKAILGIHAFRGHILPRLGKPPGDREEEK